MDYVIVIEKADDGSCSSYVPDLPGCVACGDTPEEARAALNLESLRDHGESVPPPTAITDVVHAA